MTWPDEYSAPTRSAKSAWTTSSSCQAVSSSPSFAITSAITTRPVPIEAFTSTCPRRPQVPDMPATVRRHDVLGGIIHEYERAS
jgi:hypothetical protein